MTSVKKYLTFYIDQALYGLPVESVEKVIRAVELIHYPEVTGPLQGFINMAGKIIPVVNFRKCLGLAERNIDLDDRLVIVNMRSLKIALVVDEIYKVVTSAASPENLKRTCKSDHKIVMGKGCISQIENFNGTTISFCDPDRLLTDQDFTRLGMEQYHMRVTRSASWPL